MTNNVGHQFGDYHLIKLLGHGAFADVYLGKHLHLSTEEHPHYVAIKVLKGTFTDKGIEQFIREAQIIKRLEHPHIVSVITFSFAQIDTLKIPFLVMSYAPYGSLKERHPRGSQLALNTVVTYVKQIAEALQYAHEQKVVHRDVKPANLLLGKMEAILLSDFGIFIDAHETLSRVEQTVAGTPAYMAPEQFQGKAQPASDQYAIGIITYQWLCGELPFTEGDLGYKHNFVSPPSLCEKVPSLSPEVEKVVLRALAKDPKERFANIQTFAIALDQASQQGTLTTSTTLQPANQSNSTPRGTILAIYKGHKENNTSLDPIEFLLAGGSPSVFCLSWSPDGSYIASGDLDGKVHIWEAASARQCLIYEGHNIYDLKYDKSLKKSIYSSVWSPDGSRIASGDIEGKVQVWEAASGRFIFTYTGHSLSESSSGPVSIRSVAWSPDGSRIASGGWDKTIQVWDAITGSRINFYGGHSDTVCSVVWSPDGRWIVSGSSDKTAHVWEAATGHLLGIQPFIAEVGSVAWSPNGRWIAAGSTDNKVRVWDAATGYIIGTYHGYSSSYHGTVVWSPDSSSIASTPEDKTVQIRDAATGRAIYFYRGHSQNVSKISWSPDGKRIASVEGSDETIQVWHAL